MTTMKLSTIVTPLQGRYYGEEVTFSSVSTDTRTLAAGALFFALDGPIFEGHRFLEEAKRRGAVAAVVNNHAVFNAYVFADLPILYVPDTYVALGALAQLTRQQFSGPVVVITGSCGKTTTRVLTVAILEQVYSVLATRGNLNNKVGLPLMLLQCTDQQNCMVLEVGTNAPGEIAYLADIAQPTIAVVTNVAEVHLKGLKDLAGILKEKSALFQALGKEGVAVINADSPFATDWYRLNSKRQQINFAQRGTADVQAREIVMDSVGRATFTLSTPQGACSVRLRLIGRYNVSNALAAASVGCALGIPLDLIRQGLESIAAIRQRMIQHFTAQGVRVLDDTYSSNPMAMFNALKVLAAYKGETVLIMGEMGELGVRAVFYHRRVGQWAKAMGIKYLYACGYLTYFSVEEFGENAFHFNNYKQLAAALRPHLTARMSVLVKASRSERLERVISYLHLD